MANKERGGIRLDAGAEVYTLRFTTNAMCELEDLFAQPFSKIVDLLATPESISFSDLRKMLWGALCEARPEWSEPNRETLRAIGDIADDAGLLVAIDKLAKAVEATFPDADAEKATASRKAA